MDVFFKYKIYILSIIFFGFLLINDQSQRLPYVNKKLRATNADIYECTKISLNNHRGDLVSVKKLSSNDREFVRILIVDTKKNTIKLDCDLESRIISTRQ